MRPGLETAVVLRGRGHQVQLWLAGRDVERISTTTWDGPVVRIRAEGLQGRASVGWLIAACRMVLAVPACRGLMRQQQRPDVVLAMGSFASFGPVMAARSLRIPAVLHEANAVPGRAVAFLARFADTVALAFAGAAVGLGGARTTVTGLPIREDRGRRFEPGTLAPDVFTVLVMGGSQGAQRLNEVACDAICRLHRRGVPLQVIHLTGARNEQPVRAAYAHRGVGGITLGFLEDMEKAYAAADLAVSRAGAGSCMELCAFGVPALLVPLPGAARDHQAANARELVEAGAADMCLQSELSVDWLVAYIDRCRLNAAHREAMRDAMQQFAIPRAAARLADIVENVVKE